MRIKDSNLLYHQNRLPLQNLRFNRQRKYKRRGTLLRAKRKRKAKVASVIMSEGFERVRSTETVTGVEDLSIFFFQPNEKKNR